MEKKPNHLGIPSEFLRSNMPKMPSYVPFNQAHFITKYIGANEELPKLHTLEARVGKD